MDYAIRRLSSDWVEAFRAIRLEALRLHPRNYNNTFAQECAWPDHRYTEFLERAYVFGLFHGEELAGMAALIPQESPILAHKARIGSVYLRAKHRGLGLGRRLLEHLINSAHEHVEQIYIEVAADNVVAFKLYESMGFERYGYEKHAAKLDGAYIDDILMVKFLS